MAVEAKRHTDRELAVLALEANSLTVSGGLLLDAMEHMAWLEQDLSHRDLRTRELLRAELKAQQPVVDAAVRHCIGQEHPHFLKWWETAQHRHQQRMDTVVANYLEGLPRVAKSEKGDGGGG